MANQFSVQPLGGFNLGQGLNQLANNIGQQNRYEDQQAKLEQQRQERQDTQAFMRQAIDGDPVAMDELLVRDPRLALMLEQREQERIARVGKQNEEASKQAEIEWGLSWKKAGTPEQKQALLQQALSNPLIDIDESDVDIDDDSKSLGLNYMLRSNMGKETYDSMFGGDGKQGEGFTLSEGQKRFSPSGDVIASVAPKAIVQTKPEKEVEPIPKILLEGLSADLASKASAAYTAAGGGKDGMAAFQRQVDKGTEQERRLTSPAILKSNFPKASDAEMAQLQGVMDGAKDTQSGLKAAGRVREEQKRLVKAKGFQDRAVELLTSIIDSPDLGDVTGSLEGRYDFRPFSDDESSLIADIEEAENILTADNLSLMSGVLSESDIKILKNLAGGALIRTRTEKRFTDDVTKMRDKLKSQLVKTVDDRNGLGRDDINKQALAWANANPNNPKAKAILQKLQGGQ